MTRSVGGGASRWLCQESRPGSRVGGAAEAAGGRRVAGESAGGSGAGGVNSADGASPREQGEATTRGASPVGWSATLRRPQQEGSASGPGGVSAAAAHEQAPVPAPGRSEPGQSSRSRPSGQR